MEAISLEENTKASSMVKSTFAPRRPGRPRPDASGSPSESKDKVKKKSKKQVAMERVYEALSKVNTDQSNPEFAFLEKMPYAKKLKQDAIQAVSKNGRQHTAEEKADVLKAVDEFIENGMSKLCAKETVANLHGVGLSTIKNWFRDREYAATTGNKKVDGRRADSSFDDAVSKRLWTAVETKILKESDNKEPKFYNIMYSYDMVKNAMVAIRETDPRFLYKSGDKKKWYHDSGFSNAVIDRFLTRTNFRRKMVRVKVDGADVTLEKEEPALLTHDKIERLKKSQLELELLRRQQDPGKLGITNMKRALKKYEDLRSKNADELRVE